jgi:hypothetical protein
MAFLLAVIFNIRPNSAKILSVIGELLHSINRDGPNSAKILSVIGELLHSINRDGEMTLSDNGIIIPNVDVVYDEFMGSMDADCSEVQIFDAVSNTWRVEKSYVH